MKGFRTGEVKEEPLVAPACVEESIHPGELHDGEYRSYLTQRTEYVAKRYFKHFDHFQRESLLVRWLKLFMQPFQTQNVRYPLPGTVAVCRKIYQILYPPETVSRDNGTPAARLL